MAESKAMRKNLGLDLLRVLLSFGVVLCHFWHVDMHGPHGVWRFFCQLKTAAVPAFMVMTFLFTCERYRRSDVDWLKRRCMRLWTPFLFWSFVAWCVAKICFAISGTHEVGVGDLLLQFALGANNKVSGQFWFHSNLIMLTFGFFLFFRYVRRDWMLPVLVLALTVCYLFQYTELNLLCFGNLRTGVRQPFGRLCATIPFACIGLFLAVKRGWLDSLDARMRVALGVAAAWTIWWFIYLNPCPAPAFDFVTTAGERLPSLGDHGLKLQVLAIAFVVLFYLLPVGRCPGWVVKAAEHVSQFCMGIYCTHMFLGWVCNEYLFARIGVKPQTFGSCLLLWGIAWLFCWLFSHLPGRFFKDVVR